MWYQTHTQHLPLPQVWGWQDPTHPLRSGGKVREIWTGICCISYIQQLKVIQIM